MSQFPALRPSSRSFTFAAPPVSTFASMSGKETRVITGSAAYGSALQIGFQNIQEPAVRSVLDHFAGQRGTALSFTLPSAIWAGWTDNPSVTDAGLKWRYAGQPNITAVSPGIMSLSVSLVSVA